MTFLDYADAEMMAIDLANVMAGEMGTALRQQDRATLIVPGGTTPGPVFDALCAADLEWDRVDVVLSDERWVPETDAASNAALVRARLLVNRAAGARFKPYHCEGKTPEQALPVLERQIAPLLPAAVCLLGMGADMHTASLFPRGDALRLALDTDAPTLVAMHGPNLAQPRVTLSARALAGSVALHLVITGADKRAALERARDLPPQEAPVAAILDDATVHWAA